VSIRKNQVRKYEKEKKEKRTSKRGMPTKTYLTFHSITTPSTHSNTNSTSEQRKDA